jgi:hypothetical protein
MFLNTGGLKMNDDYPEVAEKLYIGAFILTPIWAIFHKKYMIAILACIPIINLLISLSALVYGGRWAWDSKKWKSEYYFEENREKWNYISIIIVILIFFILLFK